VSAGMVLDEESIRRRKFAREVTQKVERYLMSGSSGKIWEMSTSPGSRLPTLLELEVSTLRAFPSFGVVSNLS